MYSGQHLAEDGTRIWFRVTGQGPPLVLCDGIGCDGYIWPYLMDRLDERMTMVRWHYRGHGNSVEPADPEAVDMITLAADLHGLLRQAIERELLSPPFVIAGHSMGCQVALEYALQYPEDIDGLILLCGSHGRPLDSFRDTDAFKSLLEPLLRAVDRAPSFANAVWKRVLPSRFAWALASRTEVNAQLARRVDFMPYLRHMGRIRPTTFLRMLRYAAEHSTRERLHQLEAPTLVIGGARDKFTPLRLSEEIAEMIADSELETFSEGTHTLPIELPDEVCDRVETFLTSRGLITPRPSLVG